MSKHCPLADDERAPLYRILPLSVPLGITISPCNFCDFRCIYCGQADEIRKPTMLTMDQFKVIAAQLEEFEEPIKQISFVANGETILNPELPDMIALLKERNLACKVKVVTNANRLTHEYSDRLIAAGLDTLKVSLQGLTSEKYRKICKTTVDFERIREQLAYFYDHRKQCTVHIKVIDIALDDGEEEKFYRTFDAHADYLFVEQCIGKYALHQNDATNKFHFNMETMQICSQPFFTLFIDDIGNVFPCCLINRYNSQPLGNIFFKSLKLLWNEEFRVLQETLLKKERPSYTSCIGCKQFVDVSKLSDIIDGHEIEILKRMK